MYYCFYLLIAKDTEAVSSEFHFDFDQLVVNVFVSILYCMYLNFIGLTSLKKYGNNCCQSSCVILIFNSLSHINFIVEETG